MYTQSLDDFKMSTLVSSPDVFYPHWALCLAGVLALIFATVGFFGNLLTILALPFTQRLRNASTWFVLNLAVAEILFCITILPMSAAHMFYLASYNAPLFSDNACRAFVFLRYVNVQAELLSIAAIALNRCVLISFPEKYEVIFKNKRTLIIISSIWIISIVIMCFPLAEVFGHFTYNHNTQECDFGDDTILGNTPRKVFLALGFVVPCLIIMISYSYIFVKARESAKKMAEMRDLKEVEKINKPKENKITAGLKSREIRIARTILVIFIGFMVCCLPVSITHYVYAKKVKYPTLLLLLHPLYWSQYCINVFIYVLMNKQYRDAYVNYISSWWPHFREMTREKFAWKEEEQSCSQGSRRWNNSSRSKSSRRKHNDSGGDCAV